MKSMIGLKFFGAFLLICAFFNSASAQVSTTAAFPLGTMIPTANFASNLLLTNKDDFGTVPGTSWTPTLSSGSSSSTNGFYAATNPGSTNYATALQFINGDLASTGTKTYSYTWSTAQSLSAGVRIVARIQMTAGTQAYTGPINYLGWVEGTTTSPKTYYAAYDTKTNAGTAVGVTQQLGYYDGSALQLQTANYDFATPATGLIVMLDVLPKNISFSTFDYQNQNQGSCGLYKSCGGGTTVTSVTPTSTGMMTIGGSNGQSQSPVVTLTYYIDWIAQYNYQSSASSFSVCKALSVVTLSLSVILFSLNVKL